MQFGFNAPTAGPMSATDQQVKLVVEGEAMGFDYATFSDHVVIPTDIEARYPYSATGEFPSGARIERHEQLIEMAYIAGKTRKLARDYVDSHRMLSNFLLLLFPLMIIGIALPTIQLVVLVAFFGFLVAWYLVGRRLRRVQWW